MTAYIRESELAAYRNFLSDFLANLFPSQRRTPKEDASELRDYALTCDRDLDEDIATVGSNHAVDARTAVVDVNEDTAHRESRGLLRLAS